MPWNHISGTLDFKIFLGGKSRLPCVEIEVYHNVRHLTFPEISGVARGEGEARGGGGDDRSSNRWLSLDLVDDYLLEEVDV